MHRSDAVEGDNENKMKTNRQSHLHDFVRTRKIECCLQPNLTQMHTFGICSATVGETSAKRALFDTVCFSVRTHSLDLKANVVALMTAVKLSETKQA